MGSKNGNIKVISDVKLTRVASNFQKKCRLCKMWKLSQVLDSGYALHMLNNFPKMSMYILIISVMLIYKKICIHNKPRITIEKGKSLFFRNEPIFEGSGAPRESCD